MLSDCVNGLYVGWTKIALTANNAVVPGIINVPTRTWTLRKDIKFKFAAKTQDAAVATCLVSINVPPQNLLSGRCMPTCDGNCPIVAGGPITASASLKLRINNPK